MHARFPDAEQAELTETFPGYGADPETAAKMAAAVSADPATALRFHTREELGVDADELPSPVLAGTASLVAFSLGALLPLLPYLVGVPDLAARHGDHRGRARRRRHGRRPAHRPMGAALRAAPARAGRGGRGRDLQRRPAHRRPRRLRAPPAWTGGSASLTARPRTGGVAAVASGSAGWTPAPATGDDAP